MARRRSTGSKKYFPGVTPGKYFFMKTDPYLQQGIQVVIITIFGVLVVFAFRPNFAKLHELKTHYSCMKQKLLLEEKRNYSLQKEYNGLLNDPECIEKVAREKLGWCRRTEKVYRFRSQLPDKNNPKSNN